MSVAMSDCHSWPLDVSNNLSGYFISNSVVVTSCVITGQVHLPLALSDNIEQWRVHSVLCQFQLGGPSAFGIYMFIYALVFPYIFLLVVCFKCALIDHIEQQRVHSVLWQFQMGGILRSFTQVKLTWVPDIFLLVDCFKWTIHSSHWTAKSSSLCTGSFKWGGPLSVLPR